MSDTRVNLTLFAHVAGRPEPEIDLAEAALLIAEQEYPGLPIARYAAALNAFGERARLACSRVSGLDARVDELLAFVYGDLGFRGNEGSYYDPKNSFLNDVIDRRTGIPITLAIVLIEVGRRAGVLLDGVSFPGHFLVRAGGAYGERSAIFLDPFAGRVLPITSVRSLYGRITGTDDDPPPHVLEAASKTQILTRMLMNLRAIYSGRGDRERLRGVIERLAVLAPSEESAEELEKLGGSAPYRTRGRALN